MIRDDILKFVGLHPLVGFGMVAVDMMLFGAGGPVLGSAVAVIAGIGLIIPCALIQRYGMRESWGLAIGKSAMVGLLTAIPTPIPSVIPFLGALAGARLLSSRKIDDRG